MNLKYSRQILYILLTNVYVAQKDIPGSRPQAINEYFLVNIIFIIVQTILLPKIDGI